MLFIFMCSDVNGSTLQEWNLVKEESGSGPSGVWTQITYAAQKVSGRRLHVQGHVVHWVNGNEGRLSLIRIR